MSTTRRAFSTGVGVLLASCAAGPKSEPAGQLAAPAPSFFDLVQRGDLIAVAAAVRETPALLDTRDERGRSPLTVALLADQGAIADLLLARGYRADLVESAWVGDWDRLAELADATPDRIDALHPLGGTCMHAAVRGGHGTGLWRVYAQAASPNPARPVSIASPLRTAFELPDLALVEATAATLLANGADPNAAEPNGSSALHAAAARGSAMLVEMLIRKGASLDATDERGRRPTDVGTRSAAIARMLDGSTPIARDHTRLRRAFDVHGRPYRPESIADVPVRSQRSFVGLGHGRFEQLRGRLDADPRMVHAMATSTEMAVDAAGHMGRRDIVDHLLDRGAPFSMPAAVLRGDTTVVGALLDAHPERIHEWGPHDFGLLWYPAIGGGDVSMAELLLERGAEVEAQHFLGTTGLHFAALRGHLDLAALLLDRGADVNRRGRKFSDAGDTPVELARARGHARMVDLLRDRGARLDS